MAPQAKSLRLPVALARGPPSDVSTASGSPSGSESPTSPARKAWSRTFRRVPDNHGIRFGKADRFDPDEPFWVSASRPESARGPGEHGSQPIAVPSGRPASANRRSRSGMKQQLLPNDMVPREVKEKVLSVAGRGALVIEMLWSTGAYLPAHDNGQKYLSTAKELQDLMAGRLSSRGPFPVMTIEAVKLKGMDQGIYDRYSQQEKSFGCVASNNSYSSANPSRIGAFEIHMVQGIWDPKLCAAATSDDGFHKGPPVVSERILCAACAQRGANGRPEQPHENEKQMQPQYSLLHSKLWMRRWPSLKTVVSIAGALVIPEPPEVPAPVCIGMFQPFQRRIFPINDTSAASTEQWARFEESQNEAENIYIRLCLFLIESLSSHNFDLNSLEDDIANATEAEKIYVNLCLSFLRRVPSQDWDLESLEAASAREAAQALQYAVRLNDERRAQWKAWFSIVDSWKRDDSNQEKEIFEHILNLRMDVRSAVLGDNRERITASESFQEQIQVYSKEIVAASTWKPSE